MSGSEGPSTSKPVSKSYWKGKGRATVNDFDDLNPTITYRHLVSNNLGVRDPLRVVALCDSDAFYAACEQVRLGIDPALPLVVLQWDSLIAVNYPARKFGISRMDKLREAKKRCPDLVVVHVATYKEGEAEPGYWENPDTRTHKVSLDHYRRESMKIIQMFKEGLPTGEVEKASIDEAFIDFTRPVREEILKRYPYLAAVPPDAPNGLDSPLPPPPPISWEGRGTIVPVHPAKEQPADKGGGDPQSASTGDEPGTSDHEEEGDHVVEEDDEQTTWHDVALSIAAELMMKIREDIRAKLGYTTSAGLARNKFLAKLTASYKKPMNQTVLRNAAIPNYLRPMPFQKIRFLGGKLGKALAEEYDVSTVGDLLYVILMEVDDEMQRKFGEESIWVYEILRGIDRTEVKEKSVVNKSMLASKNLPHPITKATEGYHWIRCLAAELALRLNEARDNNPALWPKTVVLHIRQGYDVFRSKQMPFPFTKNVTVDIIASFGDKLWKELVGTGGSTPFKVTNVQLSFSGIGVMEVGQRTIEGFLTTRSASDDQQPSAPASSTVKSPSKRSRSPSTSNARPENGAKARKRSDEDRPAGNAAIAEGDHTPSNSSKPPARDQRYSFICDKCHKRIWLQDAPLAALSGSDAAGDADGGDLTYGVGRAGDDGIRDDALAALRLEHADFHFAQELAAAGDGDAPKRVIRPVDKPPSSATGKKRKKKPADEGIAKFFQKR
ncbi:DNA/RNA polymerase [Cerioporus squamosus]|nr:DNA/RNA polymerase [Cerioporus squamosus]